MLQTFEYINFENTWNPLESRVFLHVECFQCLCTFELRDAWSERITLALLNKLPVDFLDFGTGMSTVIQEEFSMHTFASCDEAK